MKEKHSIIDTIKSIISEIEKNIENENKNKSLIKDKQRQFNAIDYKTFNVHEYQLNRYSNKGLPVPNTDINNYYRK